MTTWNETKPMPKWKAYTIWGGGVLLGLLAGFALGLMA